MGALTTIRNAVSRVFTKAQPLRAVDGGRGWTSLFSGGNWYADGDQDTFDWQRNIQKSDGGVLANWAIFACTTLISSDVGKLRMRLVELVDGIWRETASPAFSPVLKKPNGYQTWQQFIEAWLVSKLTRGNAYVLKERDNRGVTTAIHVLNPDLVQPLVAPNGMVFYRLERDELSRLADQEGYPAVPAAEIIHDRFNCLFHPLVGLPPIFASGLAAMQGLNIQKNSSKFFRNMSRPSGVLTAPAQISDPTAQRLKTEWEKNYSGEQIGKVAVLGDGLSYQPMSQNAVDAELVAQLKLTADMVCSTFHVPAFKIGAGTIPAGQKVGDLNQIYYADCLQALMEAIENLLDDGLGIGVANPKEGRILGTEFDLDGLLKMDAASFMATLKVGVDAAVLSPNEARAKAGLPKAEGGDSPMIQQQNYSLAAIAKRDAAEDPFGTAKPPAPPPAPEPGEDETDPSELADEAAEKAAAAVRKDSEALAARFSEQVEQIRAESARQAEAAIAAAEASREIESKAREQSDQLIRDMLAEHRRAADAETARKAEQALRDAEEADKREAAAAARQALAAAVTKRFGAAAHVD